MVQAEINGLKTALEQARAEANRLRGGVTERRRQLRLQPIVGTNQKVNASLVHTLEIDNSISHLVVVRSVKDTGYPDRVPPELVNAQKDLEARYGKNVAICYIPAGYEVTLVEVIS
jgi:hypothetical protein